MSPLGRAYLNKLYDSLRLLPEEDRLDAIREIESHIEHGVQDGQAESSILTKLGDPKKLARAYRNEYFSHKRPRNLQEVMSMLGFYCTAGLMSITIVPVLAVLAYGFGFCAILIVLAGIIRTLGASWINMNIGPDYTVPLEWSIPVAVLIGGVVGTISYFSWKNLKKYLAVISDRYRNMLETRIR